MSRCDEKENCLYSKLSESDKKNIIECHIPGCAKSFHSKCIGLEAKNSDERKRLKYSFVCIRCENFLLTIRSIISEEINVQLKNSTNTLSMATQTIGTSPRDTYCQCGRIQEPGLTTSINTTDESGGHARESGLTTSGQQTTESSGQIQASSLTTSANEITAEGSVTRGVSELDGPNDKGNHFLSNSNNSDYRDSIIANVSPPKQNVFISNTKKETYADKLKAKTPQNKTLDDEKTDFYLCSIDYDLKISEVKSILECNKISTENIGFSDVNSNFRKKKYIKLCSSKTTKFNFKMQLENSNISGTWFYRTTPPRKREQPGSVTELNKNKFSLHPTIENENLHRDRIKLTYDKKPKNVSGPNKSTDAIVSFLEKALVQLKNG